ncbi:MAG: hypothetical protein LBB07_00120, partial [Bifidobacteriaceae bacterium]|nr:hypothetical protein [Bifidobacteriaceae bacterium]
QPIPKAGWKAVYIMDAINFLNFQNSSNQKSATARIVNSWMEAFSHIEILPHEKASENNKPSAFIINSIPESILFSLQKWNTKSLDVGKNALDKDLQNAFQELQNAI